MPPFSSISISTGIDLPRRSSTIRTMSQWRQFCETHGRPYLALKFLSGPNTGSEAPLKEGNEAILGRGSDADILIEERKASRQHARLYYNDNQLFIRDLGPVNGTLVNGDKIEFKPLYPGDQVEISGVRMRLENRQRISEASWKWWRDQRKLQQAREGSPTSEAPTMDNVLAGNLRSFPIADLLKLLQSTNKTGVLVLDTVWGLGEIAFRDGTMCSAGLPTRESAPTLDAIARLIVATKGEFEFCAGEFNGLENAIAIDPEELQKAAVELPEIFLELESLIPSIDSFVKHSEGAIDEAEEGSQAAEVLKLTHAPTTLANIFDHFAAVAADAARTLVELIKVGHIKTLN